MHNWVNIMALADIEYFIDKVGRNIIHGSDSVEAANHEIGLWFTGADLCDYTQAADSWINEGNWSQTPWLEFLLLCI